MKAGKILLKTAGGLLILLIIALGCALCWLYSWTWRGELSNFHESWTPDERAALTRLDSYMRHQWVRDAFSPIPISPDAKKTKEEEDYYKLCFNTPEHQLPTREEQERIISAWRAQAPEPGFSQRLALAFIARCLMAPVAEQLVEIAADGQAGRPAPQTTPHFFIHRHLREHPTVGLTPAIAASLSGHYNALRALIRHGAEPNAQLRTLYSSIPGDEYEADLPITPLLAGICSTGIRTPWNERKQHADFLLKHGADLNRSPFIATCCLADLAIHHHPGTFLWAMEHGLKPDINNFCSIIEYPGTLPLVRFILEHRLVDVNDRSGSATTVQAIARAACRAEDMHQLTALEAEEKLRLLLQAGADSHLICINAEPQRPGESDEEYEERQMDVPLMGEITVLSHLQQRIEELKSTPGADATARLQVLERLAGLIRARVPKFEY